MEEMNTFLNRGMISQSIFQWVELMNVVFSTQAHKWVCIAENSTAKLLTA